MNFFLLPKTRELREKKTNNSSRFLHFQFNGKLICTNSNVQLCDDGGRKTATQMKTERMTSLHIYILTYVWTILLTHWAHTFSKRCISKILAYTYTKKILHIGFYFQSIIFNLLEVMTLSLFLTPLCWTNLIAKSWSVANEPLVIYQTS